MKKDNKALLRVDGIHLSFGGIKALDEVGFEVKEGEIFGIIGPNGAGKTCVLNCINGFYRPTRGEIWFEGRPITKLRPDKVAALGIGRTFQNLQLYAGLSVIENLMVARSAFFKSTPIDFALYFGRAQTEEVRHRRIAEDVLDLLNLRAYRKTKVDVLSYGLRKRVDLARALCQEPKLLVLDEPMAGVDATEKGTLARTILDVREERGTSVILVEHDMGVVMDITDRMIALDFGRQIAQGTPDEVKRDPEVVRAYLGEEVEV